VAQKEREKKKEGVGVDRVADQEWKGKEKRGTRV
jgi:hypothetical protein